MRDSRNIILFLVMGFLFVAAYGLFPTAKIVESEPGCSSAPLPPLRVRGCVGDTLTFQPQVLTPGGQYTWFFGDGTSSNDSIVKHVYNTPGRYTASLTVVDTNGCTSTTPLDVRIYELYIHKLQTTPASCNGINSGTARVVGRGGFKPYSYQWSNGQTTQTATGLAPGTYTVTITDSLGCTATGVITVANGSPIVVNIGPDSVPLPCDTSCINFSPLVFGGDPPYTYTWSNGATGQFIKYCADEDTLPCLPRIIDFDTDGFGQALPAGTKISNQWSNLGISFSFINNTSRPDVGILFDGNNPTGGDLDLGTPNQAFGGPGVGTGGGAGRPGENRFALGNLAIIAEDTVDADNNGLVDDPDDEEKGGRIITNFASAVNLTSVKMVDIDNSSGNCRIEVHKIGGAIVNYPLINLGENSVQDIIINETGVTRFDVCMAGSGALASFEYCEAVTLPYNGKYLVVQVRDDNGCIASDTVYFTPGNCCDLTKFETFNENRWGKSKGTASQFLNAHFSALYPFGLVVGHPSGFTMRLTSPTAIFNLLPQSGASSSFTRNYVNPTSTSAGELASELVAAILNTTYDSAGYFGSSGTSLLDLYLTKSALSCLQVRDVIAIANRAIAGLGTSGYSFNQIRLALQRINGNFTTQPDKGNLSCTACSPPARLAARTQDSTRMVSCYGAMDGSIKLNLDSRTTAALSFKWSDGSDKPDRLGLNPGDYRLTITDRETGVKIEKGWTVHGPNEMKAKIHTTAASCMGDDGIGRVEIVGGEAPYEIVWPGERKGSLVTDLPPGRHHVQITDARGCQWEGMAMVGHNAFVKVDAGPDKEVVVGLKGLACVEMDAKVTFGKPPFQYQWSDGKTRKKFTTCPDSSKAMIVTVVDANGCIGSDTVNIKVHYVDASIASGETVLMCKPNGKTIEVARGQVARYMMDGWKFGPCPTVGEGMTRNVERNQAGGILNVYPNPFAVKTTIEFALPYDDSAELFIFDMKGVKIATVFSGDMRTWEIETSVFLRNGVADGIYFAELVSSRGHRYSYKLVVQD